MDNNILARQEPLQLSVPESVAIVGCGGVGSWIAYFLALAGVKELWLFDGDKVEEHNLNRILLPISSIGKQKSTALKESLGQFRSTTIHDFPHFSYKLAEGIRLNPRWIVAATDTLDSRRRAYQWSIDGAASSVYTLYIEAAAEGEWGSATGSPAEWATEQEAQPGYQSVPVWVGPCVSGALIACNYILHGSLMGSDHVIRMGWDEEHGEFKVYDIEDKEEQEDLDGDLEDPQI